MICVAHPGHHLAGHDAPSVTDLARATIALTAWGEGAERFLTLLRTAPMPAHHLYTVSTAEAAATLARRRSHIGVLPRLTVAAELAAGTLVELPVSDLPGWTLTLALAYRATEAASPPVHTLRGLVSAGATDHRSAA